MGRGDHHDQIELGYTKRQAALEITAKATCFYNFADRMDELLGDSSSASLRWTLCEKQFHLH